MDDGAGLSLSDLTIANGRSGTDTGGECGICGGGVWSQGALALSNVTVTASDGGTAGGAIFSGDDAGSTLSVTDSTFTFDNADLGGALATGPSASTTISGSTFSSNVGFEQGGALQNEEGSLSIDSSTFSDNVSGQSGGAIEELTDSPLTVTNSSFTDNSTTSVSGAIDDIDSSALTLTDSRFVGNSAASDGVLDVLAAGGTVTLNGDELDHNSGGAVGVDQVDSLTATDTSFIGNHGGFGAAFAVSAGTLSLTNVTMTPQLVPDHRRGAAVQRRGTPPREPDQRHDRRQLRGARRGGGITDASQMSTGSGATGVRNTIIADNTGGDCGVWDAASASARVPAAVDPASTSTATAPASRATSRADKVGVNPMLGPPADNGGSVLTDALSPAARRSTTVPNDGCPATDARGVSRPQGASCDMGAYEFAAAGLALSKSAPATATTGVPFTYTLKTTNNGPGPSTATTVIDQLPASSTLFGATASQGSCSSSGAPAKVTCSLGLLAERRDRDGDDRRRRVPGPGRPPTRRRRPTARARCEPPRRTRWSARRWRPRGAGAPKATTAAASAIGKHGVTLNGHINSGGQPTAYFFEYGKTSSLGNITTVRHAPSSVSVADTVSHLSPGTVYRYRLVAVNDSGSSKGAVRKFKTTGPGGALRLDGTKLEVSGRTVTATFTCASKKACSGSVTITVRLASKKAVLARGSLGRIRAGKRRSVSLSVRSGGLALLAKAPKQRLAGRLSARVGSGQRGLDRAVIVTLA